MKIISCKHHDNTFKGMNNQSRREGKLIGNLPASEAASVVSCMIK